MTDIQKEDIYMVSHPDSIRCGWPKWPPLPMKHKDGRCGFLLDMNPLGPIKDRNSVCFRTVYLVNPWEFFTAEKKTLLKDVPTQVFDTVEAMILDGWQID